jgi:PAS domain S-box-containing protein
VELEAQAEELRHAHTVAEEARDRYLDLYDFAPVAYFTIDEHSRIVEANVNAINLLNLETRNNLLKASFTKYIQPAESDRFHLYHRKIFESEEKLALEIKMQRADGIEFDAQLISNQAGPGMTRIAVIDITDRKKMQEALVQANENLEIKVLSRTKELRKSEQDYRRIIETANEGIWITDPEGKILFINDKITEMIGYSKEEITGHNGLDFMAKEQRAFVFKIREMLGKRIRISEELQFYHKNGSSVWVLANASPLFETGKHTRNLYMMTDITQRKITEEELKDIPRRILQAQELERKEIGHELHDEVGQSLTYLALLLDKMTRVPAENVKEVVLESKQVNNKVLGQVRALLSNLQPVKLEHLGLIITLEQYFSDFSAKTGIKVDFTFSGDWDKLPYNLSLVIYRICQEALTNIVRYSGVKKASIRLQKSTKKLSLQIEDKGAGFRLGTNKRDAAGLIGMRERARMVGGTLEIDSAPGEGTRITALIPFKK